MARFCARAWISFYPTKACKLFRVQSAPGPQETKRLCRHREAQRAEHESTTGACPVFSRGSSISWLWRRTEPAPVRLPMVIESVQSQAPERPNEQFRFPSMPGSLRFVPSSIPLILNWLSVDSRPRNPPRITHSFLNIRPSHLADVNATATAASCSWRFRKCQQN
jgi:hypothetical protein